MEFNFLIYTSIDAAPLKKVISISQVIVIHLQAQKLHLLDEHNTDFLMLMIISDLLIEQP